MHRHTTAPSHGIGGHDAFLLAFVGQDYAIVLGAIFAEIEGAEIDPCAATHFLVDQEVCLLPFVFDNVMGIADALG